MSNFQFPIKFQIIQRKFSSSFRKVANASACSIREVDLKDQIRQRKLFESLLTSLFQREEKYF